VSGFLVLETGEVYPGNFWGEWNSFGEIVFNTSHSGYEEMSTDPSYFNQILLTTSSMQGNYGESDSFWESNKVWINGFLCLEIQNSKEESSWLNKLLKNKIPVLSGLDTRTIVLRLRQSGTVWGAVVKATSEIEAKKIALTGIKDKKESVGKDWPFQVSTKTPYDLNGNCKNGIRIAVIDFGTKFNILRELQKRCEMIRVFPSKSEIGEIKNWNPNGILLTNGPGDPEEAKDSIQLVKELLNWRPIFGICMGHQILALALGAKTFKLKFGHRGGNHPIQDKIQNCIYMTSQNHSFAVDPKSISGDVEITHINLNDGTVAGIQSKMNKCMSVQFHPESHPGPHEAVSLFDKFIEQLK
jgi:carbamoyl-phosphate synthase small subunit